MSGGHAAYSGAGVNLLELMIADDEHWVRTQRGLIDLTKLTMKILTPTVCLIGRRHRTGGAVLAGTDLAEMVSPQYRDRSGTPYIGAGGAVTELARVVV